VREISPDGSTLLNITAAFTRKNPPRRSVAAGLQNEIDCAGTLPVTIRSEEPEPTPPSKAKR